MFVYLSTMETGKYAKVGTTKMGMVEFWYVDLCLFLNHWIYSDILTYKCIAKYKRTYSRYKLTFSFKTLHRNHNILLLNVLTYSWMTSFHTLCFSYIINSLVSFSVKSKCVTHRNHVVNNIIKYFLLLWRSSMYSNYSQRFRYLIILLYFTDTPISSLPMKNLIKRALPIFNLFYSIS